jgi:hypothetical protein
MPGLVLIDDDKDELDNIQAAFFKAGIPCLPIMYINDDPDNRTGIDHVEISEFQPRIIITDLNLKEISNSDPRSLTPPIADLLKKLVTTGPYLLFFWSKHNQQVEEVMRLLEERFSADIKLPLNWGCINKNEFKGIENIDILKEKVKTLITDFPLFHALFDWEFRIANAAIKTTNTLYELTYPSNVPEGTNYSEEHNQKLEQALSIIGNETLGSKNALENPSIALDSGLSPVLNDRLKTMLSENSLWKNAVPSIGRYIQVTDEIKSALNSFYHIEEVNDNYPKTSRGVFVKLDCSILTNAQKKQKFENRMGSSIKSIIHEEFINSRKGDATQREEVRNSLIIGFVEVSAECDQAQKKTKLHRYILAALIPSKYNEYTTFGEHDNRDRAHGGIYRLPQLKYKNENYILKLSFKYQLGTKPKSNVNNVEYENTWFGVPLLRLKEQILLDISFNCAHYSSRPGIVRFD